MKGKIVLLAFIIFASMTIVLADDFTGCTDEISEQNNLCHISAESNFTICNDTCSDPSCTTTCTQELQEEETYCDETYNLDDCDIHKPTITSLSAPDEELNDLTTLTIKIKSGMELKELTIDWDDGTPIDTIPLNHEYEDSIERNPTHKYAAAEDYEIIVVVFTYGSDSDSDHTGTEVTETVIPDDDPEVTLISPADNILIKTTSVTFNFEVNDDYKVNSCTYDLYRIINYDPVIKELEYTKTFTNVELNTVITYPMTEFDDANYTWYVTCLDNASQDHKQERNFEIKTVSHPREKEINALIIDVNDFLEAVEDMGLEESAALEELGIIEDMKYYKKRLLQINQDLGNNLKFISDEDLRQRRERESQDELDDIKEKIPESAELIESKEFVKNSLSINLFDIVKAYVEAKKIELSDRKIQTLTDMNKEIQGKITISTKIKEVEIKYPIKTEKIIIVKKEITISDKTFDTILEVIPGIDLEDIEFQTPSKRIKENIYEININELENEELIYYIRGESTVSDLESTETILFEEFPVSSLGGITGYAIFDIENPTTSSIYILLILAIAAGVYFLVKNPHKYKMNSWKKEANVSTTLECVENGIQSLKIEDVEKAKQNYHRIRETFNLLPIGFKKYIYPEVEKIRVGIDRREISKLMEEYEEAKATGNKKDATRIYKNIREKYTKLPPKYQEKVYAKLMANSI